MFKHEGIGKGLVDESCGQIADMFVRRSEVQSKEGCDVGHRFTGYNEYEVSVIPVLCLYNTTERT